MTAPLTWLQSLSPVAILISGGIALFGISRAAETARKRATLDMIEKSESSEHYQRIHATFRDTLGNGVDDVKLQQLAEAKTQADKDLRRQIEMFLNHYELVSIGILEGSLHEGTYESWMRSTVIRDWNTAADYIQRERWRFDDKVGCWTYNGRLWQGFEKIVVKWAKKSGLEYRELNKNTSSHPAIPAGPGDKAMSKSAEQDCA